MPKNKINKECVICGDPAKYPFKDKVYCGVCIPPFARDNKIGEERK